MKKEPLGADRSSLFSRSLSFPIWSFQVGFFPTQHDYLKAVELLKQQVGTPESVFHWTSRKLNLLLWHGLGSHLTTLLSSFISQNSVSSLLCFKRMGYKSNLSREGVWETYLPEYYVEWEMLWWPFLESPICHSTFSHPIWKCLSYLFHLEVRFISQASLYFTRLYPTIKTIIW